MAKSKFWSFIDGYDVSESRSIGKSFVSLSYSGTVKQRAKSSPRRKIAQLIESITNLFSYTSTKSYGALSLTFGILTLIFHFSGEYFGAYKDTGGAALVIGIVFSMLAIPLLLVDRPLSLFLQDFSVSDFILFEFLCIKRAHKLESAASVHPIVAAFLGAAIAIAGFLAPVQIVLIVIAALTFIYLSFVSPEFPYICTLLALPYLSYLPYSEYLLWGVVLLTLVSFLRKVAYGKRVIHIEQYDVLIGLFALAVLVSGTFMKGMESFTGAVGISVLSLGYLLTSNIITNRRLADCTVNAVVISSLPAAVIAAWEMISAAFSGLGYSVLSSGIGSCFDSPRSYSLYLIAVIPLAATRLVQTRGTARLVHFLLLILNTGALVLTAQRFAWVVLLIGIALLLSYRAKYAAPLIGFIFLALPYILLLSLGDAVDYIFISSGEALTSCGIVEIWKNALSAFSKNVFLGIGIGEAGFAEEFPKLSAAGIENSHNFFIEIGLEAGIVALFAIFLLLLVRFRHRVTYQRYLKESDMSLISTMATVTMSLFTVFGTTHYLFENMEATYLFWFVFGLGSSALRIAKRECDDKVLYYEDTKSSDFSVAEIKIK